MGGRRRGQLVSFPGPLLTLLLLLTHWTVTAAVAQQASIVQENTNDTIVQAAESNQVVLGQPAERLDRDEVVAVSGDAEFEARKPRGLLAALFGYPDEFENVDPASSSVVADASYSVNHEEGDGGDTAGRGPTPAPQFKASQYATSSKFRSTIKAVTTTAPKTITSNAKSKNKAVNDTMPFAEEGTNDSENSTATELTVEDRKTNETELDVTIGTEAEDEDGDNSTRTERSSGNKREAMLSLEKETGGGQSRMALPPQPLPAGYILWHPVPAPFLGGPTIPDNADAIARETSNNGPMALASQGAPMFMRPPDQEDGGPPFHPHRPFFVERHFGGNAFGNSGPFPITQFSTPQIFAVPPGGPLNQNGPEEDDVKDGKRNRNRERKERNRKKKGGKKNRQKNNEDQQEDDAHRNKQADEPFQQPPLHLMLPPLPPNGFPNSPFMQPPLPNQPPGFEHDNRGAGFDQPPPQQFNRDFPPPPMQADGPPPPFHHGRPMENVAFRNGNGQRGPPFPTNMPHSDRDQFHSPEPKFPRPSPSPSAHPVKFEIEHEQRLQEQREMEQRFHGRPNPPSPNFQNSQPNFQPRPPLQQQNQLSAPNFQNEGFHHHSPSHQNVDIPPVHPLLPARPTPNFQQFPEAKPATGPMASQGRQQSQTTAASEPQSFAPTSHNSHRQPLPDVPPIHFQSPSSPFPPIRNFRGHNPFAGPPPFHPPPSPHPGLGNHFGVSNQNKDDSLIYTRDFTKSLAEANVVLPSPSPSSPSNHLGATNSPNARITTSSPPPSTFGLPLTAQQLSETRNVSPHPHPTSPHPKPFGLFSSTPHPHQLSPAASHRLPQTHPNLPDYKPSPSTVRTSTLNGPHTTHWKEATPINRDNYPSPGFHTGHKGYPSSVTAPNYVTSSEIAFHTTVAPPPRVSATTKSHYLYTSTDGYGTSPRSRNEGNDRGPPGATTYEIQYQSAVPVTTTYAPIKSRSSTSPSGVDASPGNAQAQGGAYKPGTSRILLEMGPWSGNGKDDSQQRYAESD